MVLYGGGWMYLIYVEWTPTVDFNLWIYFGGPLLQTKTPPQEGPCLQVCSCCWWGHKCPVFCAALVTMNL